MPWRPYTVLTRILQWRNSRNIGSGNTRIHERCPLIPIYIMSKDESQMPFVAENLIARMFFTNDEKTQGVYREGFQWVIQ
ncbi:MAG: hypothetical protein U5K51_03975 [Flavobacteriaceae bacterium]|nr:hypothetical protein [Flavobacteriaceae bacterium]